MTNPPLRVWYSERVRGPGIPLDALVSAGHRYATASESNHSRFNYLLSLGRRDVVVDVLAVESSVLRFGGCLFSLGRRNAVVDVLPVESRILGFHRLLSLGRRNAIVDVLSKEGSVLRRKWSAQQKLLSIVDG